MRDEHDKHGAKYTPKERDKLKAAYEHGFLWVPNNQAASMNAIEDKIKEAAKALDRCKSSANEP